MGDRSDDQASGAGPSRRDLFRAGAMGLTAAAAAAVPGLTGGGAARADVRYVPKPERPDVILNVGHTMLNPDGQKEVMADIINGVYPGPEIRVQESQHLRIRLNNFLRNQFTLIHWHGLLVPAVMDGVPYVAADPIHTQEVFVYEFTIQQSGTYWYHSHYALQEQLGVAGPFIIEPKREPLQYDHEYIIFLTDWTYSDPYQIIPNLRKAAAQMGEGTMSMPGGPDLSDVKYDAFLMNGSANNDPWKASARPGDRIRFRIINAGTSTLFRFMIDDHALTITHADGPAVQPVEVDNMLIGMAETYDAIVTMGPSGSYTIRAEAQDGSGQAIGILHTPDATPKADLGKPKWGSRRLSYSQLRSLEPTTPPVGARREHHLDLTGDMSNYTWSINDFVYPAADPMLISRPDHPTRPFEVEFGHRVFVSMKNRTKMWHPMHLHGHFFRLLTPGADDEFRPLKHTVNVPPGETVRFEFLADNPGRWFFHCHNLYHLEAGMAREFIYKI